ncbi:hypothetical protein [Thermomonospora umbrina]|uniref:Uncharacterized protein n=1 Tax=Thermomonospora umbrina TaxID=111806 RepID=A0A3D9SX88_9ACTN|nr:hypothetical protein [Thermomonospora umbrina]REF00570.1 hypothetical protein DFJ69_6120 [Thermomonospora umbrina]
MPHYHVTWEIEQWAVDPHEAALKAWRCRSGPGSLANTFIVTDPATGAAVKVTIPGADDEAPAVERPQRFTMTVQAGVTVDAATPEEARRLLDNVDFELVALGGPVRLGLVQTPLTAPPDFTPPQPVTAGSAT